jgi:hypothetical protein
VYSLIPSGLGHLGTLRCGLGIFSRRLLRFRGGSLGLVPRHDLLDRHGGLLREEPRLLRGVFGVSALRRQRRFVIAFIAVVLIIMKSLIMTLN